MERLIGASGKRKNYLPQVQSVGKSKLAVATNDNHHQGNLVHSLLYSRRHAKCFTYIYSEKKNTLWLRLRELHFCYRSLGHSFYWNKTHQLPNWGMLEGAALKTFIVIFCCFSPQSWGNSTVSVSQLNYSLTFSQPLCPLFGQWGWCYKL